MEKTVPIRYRDISMGINSNILRRKRMTFSTSARVLETSSSDKGVGGTTSFCTQEHEHREARSEDLK